MVSIPRTKQCPIAGFETLHVTYNMMASPEQIANLQGSLGESGDYDRSAVILDMHGWPEEQYPGGPFSEQAPMAVTIWILVMGFRKAAAEWANDPNSLTA